MRKRSERTLRELAVIVFVNGRRVFAWFSDSSFMNEREGREGEREDGSVSEIPSFGTRSRDLVSGERGAGGLADGTTDGSPENLFYFSARSRVISSHFVPLYAPLRFNSFTTQQ